MKIKYVKIRFRGKYTFSLKKSDLLPSFWHPTIYWNSPNKFGFKFVELTYWHITIAVPKYLTFQIIC